MEPSIERDRAVCALQSAPTKHLCLYYPGDAKEVVTKAFANTRVFTFSPSSFLVGHHIMLLMQQRRHMMRFMTLADPWTWFALVSIAVIMYFSTRIVSDGYIMPMWVCACIGLVVFVKIALEVFVFSKLEHGLASFELFTAFLKERHMQAVIHIEDAHLIWTYSMRHICYVHSWVINELEHVGLDADPNYLRIVVSGKTPDICDLFAGTLAKTESVIKEYPLYASGKDIGFASGQYVRVMP